MTKVLSLPNDWNCRSYQLPLWDWFEKGGKRAMAFWHRRSGKDSAMLNRCCVEAVRGTPGVYWYMLPTAAQARKVVWDGIDRAGRKVIDQAFPLELRAHTNNTEMKIEFKGQRGKAGSLLQLCGSDNYNTLVGANPKGIVFSEWSRAKVASWDYLSPILTENKGWAAFITTPFGKNHAHRMYKMALNDPEWFCEVLTVDHTHAITEEDIDRERRRGMEEDLIQQEYYCSFEGTKFGSYFGKLIQGLRDQGRIGHVPYIPELPVHTAWDIGVNDQTGIWFVQFLRGSLRFIDYYEGKDQDIQFYLKMLTEKPYNYGDDYVPHDFKHRSFGNIRSPLAQALAAGRSCIPVRASAPTARIQPIRSILMRSEFDAAKCKDGLESLENYHHVWDEDRQLYKDEPVHDWTSHAVDAFGQLALAYDDKHDITPQQRSSIDNPFAGRPSASQRPQENDWML